MKDSKFSEWVLRFIFGGAVSLVAGIVGEKYGPVMGGLFLAFPSILPASVTLVKKRDGREKAANDAVGAMFGSLGLIVFAATLYLGVDRLGTGISLLVALALWMVISTLFWIGLGA